MENKIHIGKAIKNEMKKQGRKDVWLAKQINCSSDNVGKLYERESIQLDQLFKISAALQTDFFALYSNKLAQKID